MNKAVLIMASLLSASLGFASEQIKEVNHKKLKYETTFLD